MWIEAVRYHTEDTLICKRSVPITLSLCNPQHSREQVRWHVLMNLSAPSSTAFRRSVLSRSVKCRSNIPVYDLNVEKYIYRLYMGVPTHCHMVFFTVLWAVQVKQIYHYSEMHITACETPLTQLFVSVLTYSLYEIYFIYSHMHSIIIH